MAKIEFRNVNKSFGQVRVIENLNLTIEDGKFTVLVGPSGCGKTTLLRMIAGIGPQTSAALIDGVDVTDVPPANAALPWSSRTTPSTQPCRYGENIEFGLKNMKVPKPERDKLIKEICDIVGLTEYLDRKPGTLSGGQRESCSGTGDGKEA